MSPSTRRAPAAMLAQVLPAAGLEVVEDDDFVAALDQRVDQVRPDEPRASRDKRPHPAQIAVRRP